ncbi:MAG TPA: TolC family protein [Acidobacteriaceae bacterium]
MLGSLVFCLGSVCSAQNAGAPAAPVTDEVVLTREATDSAPPVTITLQDAIERARKNYAQYITSLNDTKIAHEDRVQARAALLPSVSYLQQYLGTEGNGKTPNGRFVTNDGVHVYRAWGVLHQDMPAGFFTLSSYHRAQAGEILAEAKGEIASRGLLVTTTKAYYGLIVAQRKYSIAQQVMTRAQEFLRTTQLQETAGEAAHGDVIKAQLQFDQQRLAFQESQLAMENARLALAVLLSPRLNENFTAVDDIDNTPALPPFTDVSVIASRENQDVRAALAALQQAKSDTTIARAGFFPTLSLEAVYGIEANAFALHSTNAALPERGKLPNLGYFITGTLNFPIWNWGSTGSKLHQAADRQAQAQAQLSQVQREALANLHSFYNEAAVARSEVRALQEAADLASENLRLSTLRYQLGSATAFEVVDATNTLSLARNAFADGQVRYRVALANLQTLTGIF